MLAHDFICKNEIPAALPISTIVCPPTEAFARQYIGRGADTVKVSMELTAPVATTISAIKNIAEGAKRPQSP